MLVPDSYIQKPEASRSLFCCVVVLRLSRPFYGVHRRAGKPVVSKNPDPFRWAVLVQTGVQETKRYPQLVDLFTVTEQRCFNELDSSSVI